MHTVSRATKYPPLTFPDALAALESFSGKRPRKSGKGWAACCPCHADKRESLWVCERRDGRGVYLHCHAGCAFAEIADVLRRTLALERSGL